MQVISSRLNQTQRSTSFSKTNRKGLSLTSRSKCNSLPKPSNHVLDEQTIETNRNDLNNNQSQTSIKFLTQNQSQQVSFFSVPQTFTSYLSEKPITQKPKITFRYSNNRNCQNHIAYRPNPFISDSNQPLHPSQVRGRFLPCQQLRNIVITKSIQSKNANQNQHLAEKQQNVNKILIDSRRIDREIIQQEVYQSFSTVGQMISQVPQIIVNQPLVQNLTQHQRNSQIIEKNKESLEKNQSPYHMLISTAKKCESKELSPRIFVQQTLKNENIITKTSLPLIGEFLVNEIVMEEHQQDSPSTSKVYQKALNVQEHSQPNQNQKTAEVKTQLSIKTEDQSQVLQIHSKNVIQESNNLLNMKPIQYSPQKNHLPKNQQKSPKKMLRKNLSNKNLSDIENRPPESHTNSALSGRRNIKRFKEIEKRLQEIITICGKNL